MAKKIIRCTTDNLELVELFQSLVSEGPVVHVGEIGVHEVEEYVLDLLDIYHLPYQVVEEVKMMSTIVRVGSVLERGGAYEVIGIKVRTVVDSQLVETLEGDVPSWVTGVIEGKGHPKADEGYALQYFTWQLGDTDCHTIIVLRKKEGVPL